MQHFVFKYSWLISIVSSAFMGGMIWLGVVNSESQSAANSVDIVALKVDVAEMKGEVHGIATLLGVAKK